MIDYPAPLAEQRAFAEETERRTTETIKAAVDVHVRRGAVAYGDRRGL